MINVNHNMLRVRKGDKNEAFLRWTNDGPNGRSRFSLKLYPLVIYKTPKYEVLLF